MFRKRCIAFTAFVLSALMFASCAPDQIEATKSTNVQPAVATAQIADAPLSEEVMLNVLNWSDYLDERVLGMFKGKHPTIAMRYDKAESNEEMVELLRQKDSVYDVCILSDYAVDKLRKLGLLEKLDKSKLPNFNNVDERFQGRPFDPLNEYSVPYMWGTTGILYNKKLVKGTVDSWNALWDKQYAQQILMYNSQRDSIGIALKKLGFSMNSVNADELHEAELELIAQRPLVLAFATDDICDKMIEGSAAIAMIYSGDAMVCMDQNPDLEYVVPKEGGNIWIDNLVILKNGKNKEAAYQFVDFLKIGYISQLNSEYIGYSTPDKAVLPFLDDSLIQNPVYNPPKEVTDRCEGFNDLGDFISKYDEIWERVLSAK